MLFRSTVNCFVLDQAEHLQLRKQLCDEALPQLCWWLIRLLWQEDQGLSYLACNINLLTTTGWEQMQSKTLKNRIQTFKKRVLEAYASLHTPQYAYTVPIPKASPVSEQMKHNERCVFMPSVVRRCFLSKVPCF